MINIFWQYIESDWTFYVAVCFLILGVAGGILDKYLKNSIKADKIKNEFEIETGLKIVNNNNNEFFDDFTEK